MGGGGSADPVCRQLQPPRAQVVQNLMERLPVAIDEDVAIRVCQHLAGRVRWQGEVAERAAACGEHWLAATLSAPQAVLLAWLRASRAVSAHGDGLMDAMQWGM